MEMVRAAGCESFLWVLIAISIMSVSLTKDAAQHYLTHLLKGKLIESKSRIVVVSSGAIRRITDPSKSIAARSSARLILTGVAYHRYPR